MGLQTTLLVGVAMAVVSAGGAGWAAWQYQEHRWSAKYSALERDNARAVAEAHKAQKVRREELQAAVNVAEALSARQESEREQDAKVVTKEVIKYVEKSDSDNSCTLDADWVRIYNQAVELSRAGPDSGATGGGDAAPRPAGETLAVTTRNFEKCSAWRQRLISLQSYTDALRASQ